MSLSSDSSQSEAGVAIPAFLYGTAWKEEQTQRLTELALQQGFRGIDTANQRKHYHEAGVGRGVQQAIQMGLVRREDLFLQTKFTFRNGQDQRLPYDPQQKIAVQVRQSFESSLEHLGTTFLDSYVLHGPSRGIGLGPDDWEAWNAMESLHARGLTRFLGISNVNLEQLEMLLQKCQTPPRFVQNRCYAVRGWDREIRKCCQANGIIYQGFSLLTANRNFLVAPMLVAIASRYGRTVEQIVFRFAMDVGMLPLTGTTSPDHMRHDLAVLDFSLTPEEIHQIEQIART